MKQEVQKQETRIQQEIYEWYQNTYCLKFHNPRCMIYHVPNQNQQHLVAIGLLPGVSDLVVVHITKEQPTAQHLYFEVKTPTGTQSPAQKDFQYRIQTLGFQYHLVRSLSEFQSYFTPCDTVA